MTPGYVGIDLAVAKGKRLPVVICTWKGGRLVPEKLAELRFKPPRGRGNVAVLNPESVAEFCDEAANYLCACASALSIEITRIGIDAPSAPAKNGCGRRAAEKAMDRAGVSCFATPSPAEWSVIFTKVRDHLKAGGAEARLPHANQLWMVVGFQLYKRLAEIAPCIEVFPQATVRSLNAGDIYKTSREGRRAQLSAASKRTGWPNDLLESPNINQIAFGREHDRLDAYLACWVAAVDEDARIAFGNPPDDVIWLPKVEVAP